MDSDSKYPVPSSETGISACEVTHLINIHSLITQSPRILILLWGVTVPYCVFTGWLFVHLANRNAPFAAGVLAGLFLLIGVAMLVGSVMVTLHYLRFGSLRLTLMGEPPAVGKRVDGIVDLPSGAVAAWIGAELACIHITHVRTGEGRIVALDKDHWRDRRQFPVRRTGRRGEALVRFDIPGSVPPSGSAPASPDAPPTRESALDVFVWEIRIEAGADADVRRTLPIRVLPE